MSQSPPEKTPAARPNEPAEPSTQTGQAQNDEQPEKPNPPTATPESPAKTPDASPEDKNSRQILSVIGLQLVLLVTMLGVSVGYSWFHNVPSALTVMFRAEGIDAYREAIANYNFVGVTPENPVPSFFSVMIEAGMWSFAGVLARSEYLLTQLVLRRKEIRLLEMISKLIGDGAMGVAIAMAAVAFLRSTELVNLTLKTADIGAIGAIAFILGFYHEDTRRLLGNFRLTISGRDDEPDKAKHSAEKTQND